MNYEEFLNDADAVARAKRVLDERSTSSGECLLWTGAVTGRGYGQLRVGPNKRDMAHRIAWAIANDEEPPAGMHVMHSCDTPLCINPKHLSIGTPSDNAIDFRDKKRARVAGESLVAKAQAAPAGDKCNYDVLLAPAMTLRAKGWSFKAMHEWFAAEGVRVPKHYITFASAMSKRIRNHNNRNK